MSNSSEKDIIPEWLRDIQNKSWEPEILISGLLLTGLFIFPSQLYEFCAFLIQDLGVEYLGAWMVLLYTSFVVNILKMFFVIHLLLRLTWAGMVGLSYAFPSGVKNEKLFKINKDYNYQKPSYWVIKIETWCSLLFAFPVYIGIISTFITFFLVIIITISILFNISFFSLVIPFLLILVVFSIVSIWIKKSWLHQLFNTSLSSTIAAIYQSNLGKWNIQIAVISFIILSFPLMWNESKDFGQYYNVTSLEENWANKSNIYASFHEKDKRYSRAFISDQIIKSSELIPLSIAYYAEEENYIKLFDKQKLEKDSIFWTDVNRVENFIKVYVDDALVEVNWEKFTLPSTDQKVFSTYLKTTHLSEGKHTIRVEKLCYLNISFFVQEWKIRKGWAEIPFYLHKP